jgi:hypothetical protein
MGFFLANNSFFHYQRVKDLMALHRQDSESNKILRSTSEKKDYVIAVIGDSFTYGMGIRNSQRFSVVLEKKLKKIKPTKVYSIALPGDNFLQYYTNYKLVEEYIKPDLYIITMVNNDFLINKYSAEYPSFKNNFDIISQNCGKELAKIEPPIKIEMSGQVNKYEYPAATNPTNICFVKTALSEFNQDKTLYFNMIGFNPKSSWIEEDLAKYEASINIKKIMVNYIKIVNDFGGYVLNMFLAKDSNIPKEKFLVSKNEGHYSAESNLFIADKLFEEITFNKKWGFEQK